MYGVFWGCVLAACGAHANLTGKAAAFAFVGVGVHTLTDVVPRTRWSNGYIAAGVARGAPPAAHDLWAIRGTKVLVGGIIRAT